MPFLLLALAATQGSKFAEPTFADFEREMRRPLPPERAAYWRKRLGADGKGAWAKVEMPRYDAPAKERGRVVFALDDPSAKAAEVRFDGRETLKLRSVAPGFFAATISADEGLALRYRYRADGADRGDSRTVEAYRTPYEAIPRDGIAKGEVRAMPDHASAVYPGTTRPWWVYLPAAPAPPEGYALIVFQDGQWAKGYVPPVLDNMIASGDLSPTVAVFVKPGSTAGKDGDNRSREYDVMSDEYVRMLDDEILPKVAAVAPLTKDPSRRAIAGGSSGGIAAFTAAWERPQSFGLVMSWIGSYVNLGAIHGKTGGQNYPFLIRRTERKPIRIALQDGANDIDNEWGNWPLANQTMLSALRYKDYPVWWAYGNGFHNDAQGRSLMPRMLRWLFNGDERSRVGRE